MLTLSGAEVRARSIGIDPSFRINFAKIQHWNDQRLLGCLAWNAWHNHIGLFWFFPRTFPLKIKLNHSVLSSSDRGSLWRLLCSLMYPKTSQMGATSPYDDVKIGRNIDMYRCPRYADASTILERSMSSLTILINEFQNALWSIWL